MEELRARVPYYVLQLDVSEDKEVTVALLKLFVHTLKLVIDRLNRVPEKNFIAFLDMLGIKLLPALPARAPLSFALSEGTTEHVLIPARTQIAAGDVVFETEKNILASPAKLTGAYSIDVSKDAIYKSPSNLISGESVVPFQTILRYGTEEGAKEIFVKSTEGLKKNDILLVAQKDYGIVSEVADSRIKLLHKLDSEDEEGVYSEDSIVEKVITFELFKGKNLQEHILYLGHEDLFNIKGKVIFELSISPWNSKIADSELVSWQYWGEKKESKVIDWSNFNKVQEYPLLPVEIKEMLKNKLDQGTLKRAVSVIEAMMKLMNSISVQKNYGETFNDKRKVLENLLSSVSVELMKPLIGAMIDLVKSFQVAQKTSLVHEWLVNMNQILENIKTNGLSWVTIETVFSVIKAMLMSSRYVVWDMNQISMAEWLDRTKEILQNINKKETENVLPVIVKLMKLIEKTPYGKLILTKNNEDEIKEREINGIKNRWIRCIVNSSKINETQDVEIDTIKVINVAPLIDENKKGLLPDMGFYNDVPLDFSKCSDGNPIYPFGKIPKLYDTFYIASQEAFSKKDFTIVITFDFSSPGVAGTDGISLSWEYWNGMGWDVIKNLSDKSIGTINFTSSGVVEFTCPDDIKPTQVNGQENYWIRVRIVDGDYGKVKFKTSLVSQAAVAATTSATGPSWVGELDTTQIKAPEVSKLTITYNVLSPKDLQYCQIYNNLEFRDVTEESKEDTTKSFKPFQPLEEKNHTLYLGFDKKLEKGPVSIFFSVEEQLLSGDKIPRLEWECYTEGGKWVRLDVLDETRGLMRSGTVEFVFPQDFKKTKKFGEELYWIRAIGLKDRFIKEVVQKKVVPPFLKLPPRAIRGIGETFGKRLSDKGVKTIEELLKFKNRVDELAKILSGKDNPSKFYEAAENILENAQKRLFDKEYENMADPTTTENTQDGGAETEDRPKIKGIFLNTTWAVQAETIKDELVGSSEGTRDQKFTLTKTPIISEEVWVNEMGSIVKEGDKTSLEKAGFEVKENKDSKGKVTEFWVKWKPIEDLLASSKDDRHYELDRVSGELKFGDGIFGMVPPVGIDNITTSYRSGGGIKGNIAAHEVKDLKSSISFVDKAFNPLAASGGSETETTDKVIERGPQVLKHRNRAITAEDFEQMAYQASQAIAKAKCLPNFHQAQWEPGWVTVVLMPGSKEDKPTLSLQLKRQVEEYLKNHSANTLVEGNQLQVSEPVYWEVNVTTTLFATSIDVIPVVENEVFIKLREFLHPLTGGYEGKGWDFGRLPCLSDFYALLEKIEGVDHVESLSIELKTSAKDQLTSSLLITPGSHVDIEMPPHAMICNGEHEVTVRYEKSVIGG